MSEYYIKEKSEKNLVAQRGRTPQIVKGEHSDVSKLYEKECLL